MRGAKACTWFRVVTSRNQDRQLILSSPALVSAAARVPRTTDRDAVVGALGQVPSGSARRVEWLAINDPVRPASNDESPTDCAFRRTPDETVNVQSASLLPLDADGKSHVLPRRARDLIGESSQVVRHRAQISLLVLVR